MLSDKIIRLEVSSQMSREYLNFCNNANHARVHYACKCFRHQQLNEKRVA
jgi:hypothetical protein